MNQHNIAYDSVSFESVRQHEIVLMTIIRTFANETAKELIFIKSTHNSGMELNVIEMSISERMSMTRVVEIVEAINLAAYYAVHPERLGQEYELASKS